MNTLLISAGRGNYLVQYFKEALGLGGYGGLVRVASGCQCPVSACANRFVAMPIIYDQGHIPSLLEYRKKEEIGTLTPLFDTNMPMLAAHRETFASAGIMVVTADPEAIGICNDEWGTYRALAEVGIRVPVAWLGGELALDTIENGCMPWPLMAKPRWGMGPAFVYQADCREEVEVFIGECRRGIQESYPRYEAVVDQEHCVLFRQRIRGLEYGLDAINGLEGRYCTIIIKKKTVMRSGKTDAAEAVEDRGLSALGERLGTLIRHRGNLDVDMLEEDGRYYMLEMNACFGGGYSFSYAARVNLPLALVLWTMSGELPPGFLTARIGVKVQRNICMLVW